MLRPGPGFENNERIGILPAGAGGLVHSKVHVRFDIGGLYSGVLFAAHGVHAVFVVFAGEGGGLFSVHR